MALSDESEFWWPSWASVSNKGLTDEQKAIKRLKQLRSVEAIKQLKKIFPELPRAQLRKKAIAAGGYTKYLESLTGISLTPKTDSE